jgi:hypothetical protein
MRLDQKNKNSLWKDAVMIELQQINEYKTFIDKGNSGAHWHVKFAAKQNQISGCALRAKSDKVYEYVAVYVDDLAIAMKDPKEFISILEGKYKFKTKGSGPLSFHLGVNLNHDNDGTFCITSLKCIEKMIINYEKIFGES